MIQVPSKPPLPPSDLARVLFAGALMGWANLVPGVSGGTMLLVCGVYPAFIRAVTDLTALRFRAATLAWIAALAAGGALAVLASAGAVKALVEAHPIAMYSLFIGLTLGGLPLVLHRAGPAGAPVWIAAAISFSAMAALALLDDGAPGASGLSALFVAGVVGASAMVLPGLSGSYLLLLLGQYIPILGAIAALRHALVDPWLRGGSADLAPAGEALALLAPFAVGVAVGVVAVSHAIRIALERAPAPTYGLLLGLLLGAVPGLWPFQGGAELSPRNAAVAAACLAIGFAVTFALRRVEAPRATDPI